MSADWLIVKIGDVLHRIARFEPKEDMVEYHFAGTYSFARGIFAGERKMGSSFQLDKIQRIHKGDFVYCKIMAWEGAFGIVPEHADGCVMSGAFVAYEPDRERIEARYLDYYFKVSSVWKTVGSGSTGTNVRRRSLHPEQFEAVRIPLPPLPEQRRIVARIDELAAKIEEAKGLRREAVEEAEVLRPAALSMAYDEAEKVAGKTERLDALCHRITDGTHITPTYVPSGVPFLSVKDVTTGTINFTGVRHISPEEHAMLTARCKPERDDVLLTKVGTTGFAKAVDVDQEFSIFVSLALLKIDKTRLSPKFTEYMLNSSRLREHSESGTRGVGNKNLVLKFIREFPMPAPSLSEQHRIVAYLDGLQAKVDALKALQGETAAELSALLPSVLDRAFSGRL